MTRPKSAPDLRFARKLTPELAAKARADRAEGVSVSEIARRLGVKRPSIQAILAGRAYRVQIPEPTEPTT